MAEEHSAGEATAKSLPKEEASVAQDPELTLSEAGHPAVAWVMAQVLSLLLSLSQLLLRLLWETGCLIFWLVKEACLALSKSFGEKTIEDAPPDANAGTARGAVPVPADKEELTEEEEEEEEDLAAVDLGGPFELVRFSECDLSSLGTAGLDALADEVRCLLPRGAARVSVVQQHRQRRMRDEAEPSTSAALAVLGPQGAVQAASSKLLRRSLLEASDAHSHIFALHFTMREAWDLPQEDELVDASLEQDWVDLGSSEQLEAHSEIAAAGAEAAGGAGAKKTAKPQNKLPTSPVAAVLWERLREALPDCEDLHVFMDANPWAGSAASAEGCPVRVDFAGPLTAEVWEAAAKTVLACEALGVFLSRRCGVVFWLPEDSPSRPLLHQQVSSALSHWEGKPTSVVSAIGLEGMGFGGFEDMAANVAAVLEGRQAPGWHRLEWTPNGDDALPVKTF
eukprot:TRINITY_DN12402_c0_g1_i1.p1 TRINITY_DN12402_c0_g1~~TRINITY_DN12402_c0_g1_i1.p1  ORF type:complete len:452 (+),score=123.26 TRINITY_DN12402_c0_g1_i1:77-1432(+)